LAVPTQPKAPRRNHHRHRRRQPTPRRAHLHRARRPRRHPHPHPHRPGVNLRLHLYASRRPRRPARRPPGRRREPTHWRSSPWSLASSGWAGSGPPARWSLDTSPTGRSATHEAIRPDRASPRGDSSLAISGSSSLWSMSPLPANTHQAPTADAARTTRYRGGLESAGASTRSLRVLAAAYALFAALAPVDRGPPLCPFRLATGHNCPFCGLTRATHALAHGQLRRSLSFHPLAPLLWAGVIVWSVTAPRRLAARGPISSM
jgi:hypothetical protein